MSSFKVRTDLALEVRENMEENGRRSIRICRKTAENILNL